MDEALVAHFKDLTKLQKAAASAAVDAVKHRPSAKSKNMRCGQPHQQPNDEGCSQPKLPASTATMQGYWVRVCLSKACNEGTSTDQRKYSGKDTSPPPRPRRWQEGHTQEGP